MLTPEEKKLCAEWIGWKLYSRCPTPYYIKTDSPNGKRVIHFSPNDAALVIAEMVKRGEYTEFEDFSISTWAVGVNGDHYIAWLFTTESGEATNFFRAMAQWVKKRKGK